METAHSKKEACILRQKTGTEPQLSK